LKQYLRIILLLCIFLPSCNAGDSSGDQGTDAPDHIPVYLPVIKQNYSHDADAWTQGLFYEDGYLYEGTGLSSEYGGISSLRKVEIESGTVVKWVDLAPEYFGEGIALYEDRIIQLTWKSKKGFVYDRDTFDQLDEFSYATEGWGITCNGQYLIMSDGTDVLYYLDPNDDYSVAHEVNVTAEGDAVTDLNELEYINGNIYANIWQTDRIAIIQPDGEVIGWIDLEGILSSEDCPSEINVLNGIAYNPDSNSIYVTGKFWCRLFELEFIP
jgi:glutamine cyclotransferase